MGAGPGGIAAGVLLKRAGITDFAIVERAGEVGGSWRDNTYPGIGVDIPSIAYQYSFARNPNWSRFFARGAEVKAYHVEVAHRFGSSRTCGSTPTSSASCGTRRTTSGCCTPRTGG